MNFLQKSKPVQKFLILFLLIVLCVIIFFLFFQQKPKNSIYGSGIIETKEITITPKISGHIKAIFACEGNDVKVGDTLVIIEHKELIAQRKEALAGLKLARQTEKGLEIKEKDLIRDLKRARNLHQAGEISDKELESLESQCEILQVEKNKVKAQIDQAEARISLIDVQIEHNFILSPTTGIVLERYYESGELVNPGSPILKIGDPREAYLKIMEQKFQGNFFALKKIGSFRYSLFVWWIDIFFNHRPRYSFER